jgi:hypothetical protein
MKQLTRPRREAGSVMVLALLVTMLILGVGLTAMYLSSSAMKVSGNITRRQEAMSASETGVERGLAVLNNIGPDAWSTLLPPGKCGATLDDQPVLRINKLPDKKKGVVLCDNGVALEGISLLEDSSTTVALAGAPSMANLTYTVFIRNDDAEAYLLWATSSPNVAAWETDIDRRIVLRVEGTARDSLSFFAVEVVVVVPPPRGNDPCPYGQAGGCGGTNTNSGEGDIS